MPGAYPDKYAPADSSSVSWARIMVIDMITKLRLACRGVDRQNGACVSVR